MQKISKTYGILIVFVSFFVFCTQGVMAVTQVNTANVTATVLGEKPIVNLVAPITGVNDGVVLLTKIVGRNFDNAYGVSLDDSTSTVLSGIINLESNCDSNGDNCGGGGSYQKITGLSVPAGVNPGVYNVLVTTALGTNLFSDVKFTVTAPLPTATPSITDVRPSYIAAMANLADVVTVSFTIKDSDSAAVWFDGDSNISIGTVSVDNYSPIGQVTTQASVTGGERVSFDFNSNSAGEVYGKLDIRVGDGGSPSVGETDFTKVIDIFIEPSW